jgi:hypothetical protein
MQRMGAWMGRRERLHFVHGFSSVWTGTGDWDTAGGEDGGVGGGCGDGAEPFGCRDGRVKGWGGYGRFEGCGNCCGNKTDGEGGTEHNAGCADRAGTEARRKAVRGDSWAVFCAAIRSAVAGVYRGVLRAVCGVSWGGGVEAAGRPPRGNVAYAVSNSGGGGGGVWVLLREQLCAGGAAGTEEIRTVPGC